MQGKMTKVVSNKRQLRRLVELLQRNQNIFKGICSKAAAQTKWEEFSAELNSLGPPQREWHKWQRVWADLKCKIKKKKTENDFVLRASGNGVQRLYHFNDMEEAVIQMLDLNSERFQPDNRGEDSLISANESLVSLEDIKFDPEDFSQEIMKNDPPQFQSQEVPEKRYPSTKTEQSYLTDDYKKHLEDQASAQKQFYTKMTDFMWDIKRSINNVEDHIKRGVQQQDELLELKRQKLKAYKENMKCQRVDRKAKLRLKAELVRLKREKLNATSTKS